MTRRATAWLVTDRRGVAAIEFAIIAPVFCLLLMGAFDIAHSLYTRGALQGVVQKAARDSALEAGAATAQQDKLDKKVRSQVMALVNNAQVDFTRRSYRTFAEAAAARREEFNDSKTGVFANGICDGGEKYEDANNNSNWDADGGNAGQGGAKDATLYTVTMTYTSLFPLWRFIGSSNTQVVKASTVLRNQPYNDQDSYGDPVWRTCT